MKNKRHNAATVKSTASVSTSHHSTPSETKPKSMTSQMGTFMATGLIRTLGIILLIVSTGAYFQLVPLTLVFVGGYLGVQPGATFSDMDTMIWAISGVAFLVPMVWAFIHWVKYIWGRFIIHPISLFPSLFVK